ncbi:MAG: class I SAM-dependent methyltransferase [Ideonella sp.]|nr:class I SAM-dependent methyltransferase [Ideonella sp.]
MTDPAPHIHWSDDEGQAQSARWRSLAGHPPPEHVVMVGDELSADQAMKWLREGTGLLWVGDYQNARHLLQALGRRLDARQPRSSAGKPVPGAGNKSTASSLKEAFLAQRQAQGQRARLLGLLLLPFDADHSVPLRRAPDVRAAGLQAHGRASKHYVGSLRELLGLVGAHEWRKKGVPVAALHGRIHPHAGVFSPVRGEYVELVANAPLPASAHRDGAFDIGTGTGVLAAVLARRLLKVVATDSDERALACARDNLTRLKLMPSVTLTQANLWPEGKAGLVVCNPPWVPAPAHSSLDAAVYDPDSRMLRAYLGGLAAHLAPGGEGWLILSDLAEHLGLRSREELLAWIAEGGLRVAGRIDTQPQHPKVADASDPLHAARAAEVTSLWRLMAA